MLCRLKYKVRFKFQGKLYWVHLNFIIILPVNEKVGCHWNKTKNKFQTTTQALL